MKKYPAAFMVSLWLALLAVLPVTAQEGGPSATTPPRDLKFEQEIFNRLAAINSEAATLFQEATQAMDAGNLNTARQGYERVLQLVPDFPDALRRLSYIELRQNHIPTALQYARRAYALDSSAYNQIALASALLASSDATNDQTQAAEALSLAQAAAKTLPDDGFANQTLLYAGMVNENEAIIRQITQKLLEIEPSYPLGHFTAGLIAAQDGRWEQAEQELLRSQELGMEAEIVQKALNQGVAANAFTFRWFRRSAYTIGGWLLGLLALFLIGAWLSRLTLAAIARPQITTQLELTGNERRIRSLYRLVIVLTSIYFYISIPLLILTTVIGTASIIFLFIAIGFIPIQLLLIIVFGALFTLIAVVRSVFTLIRLVEPKNPLSQTDAPGLWALTEEVAQKVNTWPVEAIYISPGVEIGVSERGSFWQKLRGQGRRCLFLGLGVLPDMTQGQLKVILAHEYGHFSNRDTAGGNLALQVQSSIYKMAYGLANNGQAVWYNPAWLFVNGFQRIFLRITLGASRLQEILADRYAVIAYGSNNFIESLTHVVRRDLTFELQARPVLETAVHDGRKHARNLYTLPPLGIETMQSKIEPTLAELLNQPTSPYNSHPALKDRFELARQLNIPDNMDNILESAWSLFAQPELWQSKMTDLIYRNVHVD